MALSDRITATTSRLINKYGTQVTATITSSGTYDPTTSLVTSDPSKTVVLRGLIEQFPDVIRALGEKTQGQSLILEGDVRFTVAGADLNFVPPDSNTATINIRDTIYSVIGRSDQWVDDKIAYFVFHLRKN